jgi:hypothetical protein
MDLTGRTLAQYRVAEEISRGGMGVVYRATDKVAEAIKKTS